MILSKTWFSLVTLISCGVIFNIFFFHEFFWVLRRLPEWYYKTKLPNVYLWLYKSHEQETLHFLAVSYECFYLCSVVIKSDLMKPLWLIHSVLLCKPDCQTCCLQIVPTPPPPSSYPPLPNPQGRAPLTPNSGFSQFYLISTTFVCPSDVV